MPYTDRLGRVCGFLNIEEIDDTSHFHRRYFILDVNMGKISYYMDNPIVSEAKKTKSKIPFCFAIHVAGTKYYLQADNDHDLERWIDALREATKIQVSSNDLTSSCTEWRQDVSSDTPYFTEIAGGVVCKLAAPDTFQDDRQESPSLRRASQIRPPSIVKTGYCVKQGAMRKNWKRRFFVLDTNGLAYFGQHTDRAPIKSINKGDILDVRISNSSHTSRDNLFEIVTSKRIFYVQTDSVDERQHWIQCVQSVMSTQREGVKSVLGVDLLSSTASTSNSDNEIRSSGVWV